VILIGDDVSVEEESRQEPEENKDTSQDSSSKRRSSSKSTAKPVTEELIIGTLTMERVQSSILEGMLKKGLTGKERMRDTQDGHDLDKSHASAMVVAAQMEVANIIWISLSVIILNLIILVFLEKPWKKQNVYKRKVRLKDSW